MPIVRPPHAASLIALALALAPAGAAHAQTAPRPSAAPSGDVVVQGARTKLSGWREAETSHVVIVSDGPEADLARMASNVERLHFLLSGLLGRTDAADDTVKLRVTLIGDVAEFQNMDLRNARWQQGPFADVFNLYRYYDPRDTGAVAATTRVDQSIKIEHTTATPEQVLGVLEAQTLGASGGAPAPGGGGATPADTAALQSALIGGFATANALRGPHDLTVRVGDGTPEIPVTAESLLYAAYAQHYLLTYFPAAYPRWYLDGFGQIFASLVVRGDDVLEFGRSPKGTSAVLNEFGSYPLGDVLSDKYLTQRPLKTRWTPIHAWLLTHFLFFSDTRRPQLNRYLEARANGVDAATAARVFGDERELARELQRYFGAKKPYEAVRYPAAKGEAPVIHRLTEGEAAFVKGRLELGARVLLPAAPPADADPQTAERMTRTRDAAVRARDAWLDRLSRDADRWPREETAQLLLAEGECRSGHADPCLQAATRAAALAPLDPRPAAWRGMAMAEAAVAGPAENRAAGLAAARVVVAAANHRDNDAIEPLLAFYASWSLAGAPPPVSAIDGLQKAMEESPAAPATRVKLGEALANRGNMDGVRQVVLPVAVGPYDSPERPEAQALLAKTGAPATPQPVPPAPAQRGGTQ